MIMDNLASFFLIPRSGQAKAADITILREFKWCEEGKHHSKNDESENLFVVCFLILGHFKFVGGK